jgi:predicted lipoprotein with Yx(FWY)xxD motif
MPKLPSLYISSAASALLLALGSLPAHAADPATVAQTAKGPALVDAKGMTLYTFDKDSAGKSACNGKCAENWPPLMATAGGAGANYAVVTRDDGAKQWAYKGKPLYGWVKDTKPGDVSGDGVNGAWHVAQP